MRLNRNLRLLFLLLVIIGFLPLQIIQAAVNVDTLYTYPEDVPVLDGSFESSIWTTTRKLDIKLYGYDNQDSILYLSIMAVYNVENGSISFAVKVPDETIQDDMFVIVFKTNTTEPLLYYEDHWRFSENHDQKIFFPYINKTEDGLSYNIGISGLFDTGKGGTNDVQGIGTHDGSYYSFEINTPLASGDTLGNDFSLAKKDTIDFFVFYKDNLTLYSQIRETDGVYEYCTLKIGKKGLLGSSSFFIVAALISSMVIITYVSRKRKRFSNK